jgi:hypothetical protein
LPPALSWQAKGQFKKQSVANGVEISVPVPSDADSPRFKTSVGSAKYVPEKNVVIWSIKSFPVSAGKGGARVGGTPVGGACLGHVTGGAHPRELHMD